MLNYRIHYGSTRTRRKLEVDAAAVVVVQVPVDLRVDDVLLLPGRVAAHHIGPLAVARGRPASVPGVVHELDITTSAWEREQNEQVEPVVHHCP